ncbi:MAG: hypothetical protein PUD25_00925 [Bacilli bacterium]|nr:hypothetical protein [Bacilli bacterium]
MRKKNISVEYPFILLSRILNKYEWENGVIRKNGSDISVNKIRKELNLSCYRMNYTLSILERFNVCKVVNNDDDKKIICLNPKFKKIIKRMEEFYE